MRFHSPASTLLGSIVCAAHAVIDPIEPKGRRKIAILGVLILGLLVAGSIRVARQ